MNFVLIVEDTDMATYTRKSGAINLSKYGLKKTSSGKRKSQKGNMTMRSRSGGSSGGGCAKC